MRELVSGERAQRAEAQRRREPGVEERRREQAGGDLERGNQRVPVGVDVERGDERRRGGEGASDPPEPFVALESAGRHDVLEQTSAVERERRARGVESAPADPEIGLPNPLGGGLRRGRVEPGERRKVCREGLGHRRDGRFRGPPRALRERALDVEGADLRGERARRERAAALRSRRELAPAGELLAEEPEVLLDQRPRQERRDGVRGVPAQVGAQRRGGGGREAERE